MNMKMSPGGMCGSLLVNDRSNCQRDGKTTSQRTTRRIGDKSCTFGFAIWWDTIAGFFVSLARNSGCAKHKYHIHSTTSVTSCLLSHHTKFDNMHSCTNDHSKDASLIGLRQEGQIFWRNLQQIADNANVFFLAIAWVFKPELRYFKLFPQVIHVDDGTSHSTQKKYDLITFSVKTSLGRQVVPSSVVTRSEEVLISMGIQACPPYFSTKGVFPTNTTCHEWWRPAAAGWDWTSNQRVYAECKVTCRWMWMTHCWQRMEAKWTYL